MEHRKLSGTFLSKLYPWRRDPRAWSHFPFQVVAIQVGREYSSHIGYMQVSPLVDRHSYPLPGSLLRLCLVFLIVRPHRSRSEDTILKRDAGPIAVARVFLQWIDEGSNGYQSWWGFLRFRVAQRGTSYIPNNFGRHVFIDYSLDQHLARQRNHGVAVYAILNILPAIVNVNSLAISRL